jgi:hypothetical protein
MMAGAQSNKRMHSTADTMDVMYTRRCGAARDARRSAAGGKHEEERFAG